MSFRRLNSAAFYYSPFTIYYLPKRAPVAQLDRVPDYESGGRMFESCRVHQILSVVTAMTTIAFAPHTYSHTGSLNAGMGYRGS
jgi:hypothetical protein